jgi:hypothetical protein
MGLSAEEAGSREAPMPRPSLSALALLALIASPPAVPAQTAAAARVDPRAAFERLKSLAGTWEGRVVDEAAGPAARVHYRVASNGSVVMETQFPGTEHEMISMYHMEGDDLVITHYCAMANQPRMRFDGKASAADRLVFAFDGGAGFDPAKDAHVHSGIVWFKGEALHSEWAVWQDGKESTHNRFFMKRKPK